MEIIDAVKFLPDKGYFQRMIIYLDKMFPIAPRLAVAVILYLSFTLSLCGVHGFSFEGISMYSILGIWGIFAITLILRLMDELKDRQTDMILFKDRPLPLGQVKEGDIRHSLFFICLIYIVCHLISQRVLLSSAVTLGYAFLMFKYFFLPRKSYDCLLLNLATHNPITVVILLHLTTIFSVQYDIRFADLNNSFLIILLVEYWFLFLSWEISRKIRYPREETEYITYSRIFGYRRAAFIAFTVQSVSFAVACYLYTIIGISAVYLIIVMAGYLILVFGYAKFLLNKMSTGIKLRTMAETYAIIMMLATIVDSCLKAVN